MKLNIAVIFGGRSVEHEISIISAIQCIKAIDINKYNVIPIYITKNGIWYTGNKLQDIENFKNLEQLLLSSEKVILSQNTDDNNLYKAKTTLFGRKKIVSIDLIFPVMHGSFGEDGCLQGLLTTTNIPFVGCDVLSSAIAMDKIVTKMILNSAKIPTLEYVWFYSDEWINNKNQVLNKIFDKLDYPLIIKPANLGSSIGVGTANNASELENAVDLAVSMSQRIIVEPKLENLREINCAVLGDNESIEVSVCEEPVKADVILSFSDKYLNQNKTNIESNSLSGMSGAKRKIPAEIDDKLCQQIQNLAQQAFQIIGCCGVVRIDFMLDTRTNQVYICELNTIPGSLAFYLWEYSNKNFTNLTNKLIDLALKRYRKNNNLISSYNTNILQGLNDNNFNGTKTAIAN